MSYKILSWHTPPTFPPDLIPEEVVRFMGEAQGMVLSDAAKLAKAVGLRPRLKRLPEWGANVWGFSLDYEGFGIPTMVKVSLPGQAA